MTRGMSRAERLREMERLYVDRAYTDIEMAERLGVDRITVYKDRAALETEVQFTQTERGRWRIDRTKYLSSVRLSLSEALALYLPARRAARQTLMAQPHMANALEKLAAALRQPMTERLVKAANVILAQAAMPERVAIMETVTRGWVERKKIQIAYRGLRARQTGHHLVSPYLIEPALWSDGAYVIGHSDYFDDVAVFKIERIEQAILASYTFEIPEKFDEQELLRYAWGIWRGEGEPERVVLRFAPGDATRRIKESIWHPQQEPIRDLPNGGCEWAARIAEWQEMVPWIRGWGADCEALEPKELREGLVKNAEQLMHQYQVLGANEIPAYRLLWAKADRRTDDYHLLLYHMIDVGQVVLAMWQSGLNDQLRRKMAEWLGLSVGNSGGLIAFWAGLHDLGKASPAFQDHPYMRQSLRAEIKRGLAMAGMGIPERGADKHADHEVISTWSLDPIYENDLAAETGLSPEWAKKIGQALGGHHGAWIPSYKFNSATLKNPDDVGETEWTEVRRSLIRDLMTVFGVPAINPRQFTQSQDNAMLTLFSGIVSVADWLGSDEKNFPYEQKILPTLTYTKYSRKLAELALLKAEWTAAPLARQTINFRDTFGFDARRIQNEAIEIASKLEAPALVIIEAPMGSGKTESALSIYDAWARAAGQSGLYVAMPTTATSNQMHGRTEQFLQRRYGDAAKALLVHSHALLREDVLGDDSENVEEKDKQGERTAALTWFLPRKKSLLVPFGVGTVDQALMSVLQTKHFFVRLLGLSHKVVIFDEVHAYDTYMTTLFQRLLAWLHEIGTSVIVLSATLPDKTRRELVKAYAGKDTALPNVDYPRLTYATAGGETNALALSRSPDKPLELEWISRESNEFVRRLREELREGGCAAIICNTVTRAQQVYKILEEANLCDADNFILFHARFPQVWRDEIERKVLDKFGKDRRRRPQKAVVVATQVIEQSLDLDFDVMISDIAPMDLLLQRAGRLHRHEKDTRGETNPRRHPFRLIITCPDESQTVPVFDRGDATVYERFVLLRTWVVLRGKEQIQLPSDISGLIECVYTENAMPNVDAEMQVALRKAYLRMEEEQIAQEDKAEERLVREPSFSRLLWQSNMQLEEDNPELHQAFQALTRDTRPNVSLICLHQTDKGLALEPDGTGAPIDLERPSKRMVIELMRRAVNVEHNEVVFHFLERETPWKKISPLRYHRYAIFTNDVSSLDGISYTLRLTRKLGLEISRKEAK